MLKIGKYDHLNQDEHDQIRELTMDQLAERVVMKDRGWRRMLAAMIRALQKRGTLAHDCDRAAAIAIIAHYEEYGDSTSR